MITTYCPITNTEELERAVRDEEVAWHFNGLRIVKGVPVTLYFTSGVRAGNIVNIDNGYIFMTTAFCKIAIKISEVAAVEVDEGVARELLRIQRDSQPSQLEK